MLGWFSRITLDHAVQLSEDGSRVFCGVSQKRQLFSLRRVLAGSKRAFSGGSVLWLRAATATATWVSGSKGRRDKYEMLWRDLFSDPSQWWDHRAGKTNARFPDFKHKHTGEALWLIDGRNPPWVLSEINLIEPGLLQLHVSSWHQRLSRHNKAGQFEKTMKLFEQMQEEGVNGDPYIFVHVVTACSALHLLDEGRRIHRQIIEIGCEMNLYVSSCLVDMYAKCGGIEDAWRVFGKMPKRNVVAWNGMILGFSKCGKGLKALELFKQMRSEGIEPDPVTFVGVLNACASIAALEEGKRVHKQIIRSGCESDIYVGSSLVDMYAKCGSLDYALRVFKNMHTRNVASWNAMIMGFAMHGHAKEAVALFEEMSRAGSKINEITFVCLLSACSHGGLVKEGLQYFESMRPVYGVSPTLQHYTCMVDILGRAGRLDDAEEMLNTMPLKPCAACWTALLGACRIHRNVEIGERASKRIMELDPQNASSYTLLSSIYAAVGDWQSKAMVEEQRLKNSIQIT